MGKLQSYSVSIALTKFQHGFIQTKKGTKCLVLPIDENYFTEKDGAVYAQTDIVVMDFDVEKGTHGFQVQKLSTESYKKLGAEKAKEIKLPYLGNLKIFAPKNNDSVPAQEFSEEPESDYLPF